MVTMTNGHKPWIAGLKESGAPEISSVMSLLEQYKQYYHTFHANCAEAEDYYYNRNTVPVPEGFAAVRPATAHSLVNVATDHVDVSNISIEVLPPSPRGKARSERIKKFLQGYWLSIKNPVLRTAARHAFAFGISFIKDMYDSDVWPDSPPGFDDFDGDEEAYKEALADFQDRRCIRWPFRLMNVSPRNMIWDDSRTRMKWAIEFYQREVRDIKHRYPEWITNMSNNQVTDWIEYWDEEWYGYIAGGQWVMGPHRHGYGYLPYTPVYPANSLSWADGLPHERYQGLITPVKSLLNEQARTLSAQAAILQAYAWPTLNFSGNNAQAIDATRADYELFGGFNKMLPGVTVATSPMATAPQELYQHLNVLENEIEMATFPNVIRGVRPRGVSTGFGISVLSGMGRLVFQGVADGLARAMEQVNSHALMLIENKIRGKVTVHARSEIHNFDQVIGPDDIKGFHENVVSLKAEAPEERERETLLAIRGYQADIFSKYEAQRRAGVINPLEEQMQQTAEKIANSPEFLQAQIQLAAERMGLLQQLAEATSPTGSSADLGNQFVPGMSQLQEPGQAMVQSGRVASQQGAPNVNSDPSVFPRGFGGIDQLASRLGGGTGGAVNVPSGQRIE